MPHGTLQFRFGYRNESFAARGKLAHVFTETRVTFAGESTIPDLVVYLADRVPSDEHGQVAEAFLTPPDIAVEILSPGQTHSKVLERCRWYAENGVRLALFTDPARKVARLSRPGTDSGEPLSGFALTVDELFAPLAARWT